MSPLPRQRDVRLDLIQTVLEGAPEWVRERVEALEWQLTTEKQPPPLMVFDDCTTGMMFRSPNITKDEDWMLVVEDGHDGPTGKQVTRFTSLKRASDPA